MTNQQLVCKECGRIFGSSDELDTHNRESHNGSLVVPHENSPYWRNDEAEPIPPQHDADPADEALASDIEG